MRVEVRVGSRLEANGANVGRVRPSTGKHLLACAIAPVSTCLLSATPARLSTSFPGDQMAEVRKRKDGKPNLYLQPESKQALLNRLARIEGHVRSLSRMVEEREWADDILLQVSAVKGALTKFAVRLVEDELQECLACATASEKEERIERLTRVLSTVLKQS